MLIAYAGSFQRISLTGYVALGPVYDLTYRTHWRGVRWSTVIMKDHQVPPAQGSRYMGTYHLEYASPIGVLNANNVRILCIACGDHRLLSDDMQLRLRLTDRHCAIRLYERHEGSLVQVHSARS
jgi:hypothetical protein